MRTRKEGTRARVQAPAALAALLGSAGGLLLAASPVAAAESTSPVLDPIGPPPDDDTGRRTDGNPHRYCFAAVDGVAVDNINATYALTAANSDMDLAPAQPEGCVTTGSTQTDARWFTQNIIDPGVRGETQCMRIHASGNCDRHDITMDLAQIWDDTTGAWYEENISKTACHEGGHGFGLTHYKDGDSEYPNPPDGQHDCMISGWVNDQPEWRVYSAHHKDAAHINAVF